MSAQLDLVAIGEPLIVMIPDRPGALRHVTRFERALGGAECNVLRGLARLGRRGGLISRVGDDEFGVFACETLRGAEVDVSRVAIEPTRPTGLYFKEALPLEGQSRAIYYRAGSAATALTPDDIDANYITGARALLVTGITALLGPEAYEAVGAALDVASSAHVMTVFDPNLRSGLWGSARVRELMPALMGQVDVYLGGEWETRHLLDADPSVSCRELAEKLACIGPREVVIKRGSRGAVALDAAGHYFEQAPVPTTVASAVGAGDAFNAGYLYARQQGDGTQSALRVGAVCGAAACAGVGDFETFPRASDLAAYLESGAA